MTNSIQKIINNKKFYIICLAAIVLFGIFLRIINLDLDNLFTDEAQSIYYSQYNLKDITKFIYYDNHPPLHFYLLHFWMEYFGTTEFAARFLSVIFGVLSIILMFLLGKEIFNKKVGISAAFFTAISIFHIAYSQEIRGFILLLCLIILSLLFFWKAIHKNHNIHWILFIIFSVLSLYTHHFAWTTIIALNIFVFFSKEFLILRKKWIKIQFIILLFYLPYLPSLFISTFRLQFGHWTQLLIPSFTSYIDAMICGFIFLNPEFLNYFSRLLQPLGYFLILFLLLNALLILKIDKITQKINIKIKKNKKEISFLLLLYIIPFSISFIAGIYNLRYLTVAFPAFCLILSKGFIDLKNPKLKIGIALLIIFLIIPSVKEITGKYYEWDKTANYIERNENDKDLVIIHEFSHFYEFNYYYKGKSDVFDLLFLDPGVRTDMEKLEIERIKHNGYCCLVNENNVKQLDLITKGYERIWFVKVNTYLVDYFDLAEKYFNKNWKLKETEVFLFDGKETLEVFLYTKN